jgi:cellulose synthase/poly-beta-1,6-N-acetylglucosamine synthase-like glycosyltransferase
VIALVRWTLYVVTLVFSGRRYLHWLGSCLRRRRNQPSRARSVVVLVPARNEETVLPRLLTALDALDYPRERLSFVLVNDASTDGTGPAMSMWAETRPNARTLHLPTQRGKAGALMAALAVAPRSDLVAIFDADTEPEPASLAWLAGAFDDPRVGAAGGYARPGNARTSITSRYAALERWICHLVTLAGKDRLGQNPPVLGAICAIRRRALDEAGEIPGGTICEDVWLSMRLTSLGWRTRWIVEAVAREDVASGLSMFWEQRLRWSRGQLATGRIATTPEDWLVSAGYIDRLAFVAVLALVPMHVLPLWLPAVYVVAPVLTMLTAARRAKAGSPLPYLVSVVAMFVADVGVTAASVVAWFVGTSPSWATARGHPERSEGSSYVVEEP